jgi:hypothetical protein
VECAHWRRSDSTLSRVPARTGWHGPDEMPSATRMKTPPLTDFSPKVLLRQQGPHGEPVARRQDHQVSVGPEWCMWNSCHDEPNGWRRSYRDPSGTLARTTRSHAHDGTLLGPLHASTDTPKTTAKEWCGVGTHHFASTKVAQLRPTPGSSREASPGVAIQGAEEGAKAGKKRHKQRR